MLLARRRVAAYRPFHHAALESAPRALMSREDPTRSMNSGASQGVGTRIVADIGGTNARFATVGKSPRQLERIEVLTCADYPRIDDAIDAYLDRSGITGVTGVCLAVAGPTDEDMIDLPNNDWRFSRASLEAGIGCPLIVVNDFTAQAMCVDLLLENELRWFGDPRPEGKGFRAVLGPGTGLGVAFQTPGGEIVPSEAGHVSFAPTDNHGIELLKALHERCGRVSIERILSGPGLENLYWANARLDRPGTDAPPRRAEEITALAEAGDVLALRTVADFLDILAAFAGDMALTAWATGGVYLSGGVLGKLMPFLEETRFRSRFRDKGRFRSFCDRVPVSWIRAEHPGLLGCSAALVAAERST